LDLTIATDEDIRHWRLFWALLSLDMTEPFLPAFGLSRDVAPGLRGPARHFTQKSAEVVASSAGDLELLLLAAFGEVKATFELPFAERLYRIATHDFPRESDRHVAAAWLTVAFPMMAKEANASQSGISDSSLRRLQAALSGFEAATLPWDRLLDEAEERGPGGSWDSYLCAPGNFYKHTADEFRPVDWLWDAIQWIHFRNLWQRIEADLSSGQIKQVHNWASELMRRKGLSEIRLPAF
jgi:hypothetical protein